MLFWEHTRNVLVINDGSTDGTTQVLKDFTDKIEIHHLEKNSGKGVALLKGFELAIDLGYERAITIDSDGQHRATDLPNFYKSARRAFQML